jgi:hypothetical protein
MAFAILTAFIEIIVCEEISSSYLAAVRRRFVAGADN